MSLFSWITGKHLDEQPDPDEHANNPYWSTEDSDEDNLWIGPLAKRYDEECAANPTPYGQGQAGARFEIDDMRRYYEQYGYGTFRQGVERTGKYWDEMVKQEQKLVEQGYTERQYHLDVARGFRSMYD